MTMLPPKIPGGTSNKNSFITVISRQSSRLLQRYENTSRSFTTEYVVIRHSRTRLRPSLPSNTADKGESRKSSLSTFDRTGHAYARHLTIVASQTCHVSFQPPQRTPSPTSPRIRILKVNRRKAERIRSWIRSAHGQPWLT